MDAVRQCAICSRRYTMREVPEELHQISYYEAICGDCALGVSAEIPPMTPKFRLNEGGIQKLATLDGHYAPSLCHPKGAYHYG